MSRTLVGEEPSELSGLAMSLLVSREEPHFLVGTVFSNKGNSFRLPAVPNFFDISTQFVDTQVGIRTIHRTAYCSAVMHRSSCFETPCYTTPIALPEIYMNKFKLSTFSSVNSGNLSKDTLNFLSR